jgi:hypothetical protein
LNGILEKKYVAVHVQDPVPVRKIVQVYQFQHHHVRLPGPGRKRVRRQLFGHHPVGFCPHNHAAARKVMGKQGGVPVPQRTVVVKNPRQGLARGQVQRLGRADAHGKVAAAQEAVHGKGQPAVAVAQAGN